MKKNYVVKLKVKEALDKRKLSQKKLAEMSGIRESTISDIVRGTRTVINFEHLSKIAEALEVTDIRELIDFEQLVLIQGVQIFANKGEDYFYYKMNKQTGGA